jgi:hypothetical protein
LKGNGKLIGNHVQALNWTATVWLSPPPRQKQ